MRKIYIDNMSCKELLEQLYKGKTLMIENTPYRINFKNDKISLTANGYGYEVNIGKLMPNYNSKLYIS